MKTQEPQAPKDEQYFNARLQRSIDFLLNMQDKIRNRSVEGLENIDQLESGESVIIAVSHSTGFDIPLVIDAVDGKIDIAVADQSTHHKFGREPSAYFGQKVAGSDNFIPVSYSWHDGVKSADQFNPQDADPMVAALKKGKSVIVAAHNPLAIDTDNKAVNPKPGYLAAYLANLSGHRVLPVGIDYKLTEESLEKYDAVVRIGEPFELRGLADADAISSLSKKRQTDTLSTEESKELVAALAKLRRDGGEIFGKVQSLQHLDLGYPVLDKAYTKTQLGKSAVSSPGGSSFPRLR